RFPGHLYLDGRLAYPDGRLAYLEGRLAVRPSGYVSRLSRYTKSGPAPGDRGGLDRGPALSKFGGGPLSHKPSGAVPSPLAGLASGFGMGPGVSLTLKPPKHCETPCGVSEL